MRDFGAIGQRLYLCCNHLPAIWQPVMPCVPNVIGCDEPETNPPITPWQRAARGMDIVQTQRKDTANRFSNMRHSS